MGVYTATWVFNVVPQPFIDFLEWFNTPTVIVCGGTLEMVFFLSYYFVLKWMNRVFDPFEESKNEKTELLEEIGF